MKVIESPSKLHPSKRANIFYSPQVSEAQLTNTETHTHTACWVLKPNTHTDTHKCTNSSLLSLTAVALAHGLK